MLAHRWNPLRTVAACALGLVSKMLWQSKDMPHMDLIFATAVCLPAEKQCKQDMVGIKLTVGRQTLLMLSTKAQGCQRRKHEKGKEAGPHSRQAASHASSTMGK